MCPQIIHNLNDNKLYVIDLTVLNCNELKKEYFYVLRDMLLIEQRQESIRNKQLQK